MRLAVLQLVASAGDVARNLAQLETAAARAVAAGADLLVAPELALTGYGAAEAIRAGADDAFTYAGRSSVTAPDGAVLAPAPVAGEALLVVDVTPARYSASRRANPHVGEARYRVTIVDADPRPAPGFAGSE